MHTGKLFSVFAFCLFILSFVDTACASKLLWHVSLAEKPAVNVEISLDIVEKLAGVKVVIEYDEKKLIYSDMAKGPETSALLHVVNDKKPGRLIVVMAGASGVSGKNIKLLELKFQAKETAATQTFVKVTEIQLMSEDLKEIPCPVSSVDIAPGGGRS